MSTSTTFLGFILLGLTTLQTVHSLVLGDQVKSLPGWDAPLPSRHFSGYLNFSTTKHMHYYLVEAEADNADKLPLVLWLNGGPGCSSLDGFIYEMGPFQVNESNPNLLLRRKTHWAQQANLVFFESPVGVGFSYSDNPDDYVTNDDITAEDNLAALETFFKLYPEKTGEFFIAGESYAGIYVPTLAEAIMRADKAGKYAGPRLQGIAVGNGCTGTEIGVCGGQRNKFDVEYFLGTAMISKPLKESIRKECDFSGPDGSESAKCTELLSVFSEQIGNVNLYNVYGECRGGPALKAPLGEQSVRHQLLNAAEESKVKGPVPCIDSILATQYFTQPEVMEAIHVKKPPYEWATCKNQIKYTPTRKNLPRDTYPELIGYTRVLIYNGDWDSCVPYTDNQEWTAGVGYNVKTPWHPWTYKNGQVGGYATVYASGRGNDDFTFITIRGGRHEVPETAPLRAYEMVRRMLSHEPF